MTRSLHSFQTRFFGKIPGGEWVKSCHSFDVLEFKSKSKKNPKRFVVRNADKQTIPCEVTTALFECACLKFFHSVKNYLLLGSISCGLSALTLFSFLHITWLT